MANTINATGITKIDMTRDYAPIRNTCPTIDKIIGCLDEIGGEAGYIKDNHEDFNSEVEYINRLINKSKDLLEDVRSANSTLRDWGNEEHERANRAEEEAGRNLDEVESLKDEVKSLYEEIASLRDGD